MEVHFYQLQSSPLARVVHDLSARCLQNGWKVNVVAPSSAKVLDDQLWSFDEESFFPHCRDTDSRASDQNVVVSAVPSHANNATALVLTGMSTPEPATLTHYERVSVLFDGRNNDELQNARSGWKSVTSAGVTAKYWSQENGSWEMKASNDAK